MLYDGVVTTKHMPIKPARLFYGLYKCEVNMKNIFIYTFLIYLFSSCEEGTAYKTESGTDIQIQKDSISTILANNLLSGCYSMSIKKDTAMLQLEINSGKVTGTLSYKRFKNGKVTGALKGKIINNIIKSWYNFNAETGVSVRAVYFKISGNNLVEGYGDIDIRHDTAYFKYPATLRYEESHPYFKFVCK